MATFKIALEDKAAFLNRMEKAGVALDTDQAVDNKLEGYFEVIVDEPKQLEAVQTILKQSPKINTIKEMETKKKLTKSELKEMVRQELQGVLAEKKKAKAEKEEKEKMDEALDPSAMEAIQALGGFAALAGTAFGIVKLGVAQAKKEIVAKLKAKGEDIPDDKTLDKLATQAFKGAMDSATGYNR
jgi:cytochrome c-type biogenesis protein CcmH/NrfG